MHSPEIYTDYAAMSDAAAKAIVGPIWEKPDPLLCLATGSTPTGAYELLAKHCPKSLVAHARVLKLDEWGGIPMNSPATCETYLRKILIDPLDLGSRYVGFESQPADPQK